MKAPSSSAVTRAVFFSSTLIYAVQTAYSQCVTFTTRIRFIAKLFGRRTNRRYVLSDVSTKSKIIYSLEDLESEAANDGAKKSSSEIFRSSAVN